MLKKQDKAAKSYVTNVKHKISRQKLDDRAVNSQMSLVPNTAIQQRHPALGDTQTNTNLDNVNTRLMNTMTNHLDMYKLTVHNY